MRREEKSLKHETDSCLFIRRTENRRCTIALMSTESEDSPMSLGVSNGKDISDLDVIIGEKDTECKNK